MFDLRTIMSMYGIGYLSCCLDHDIDGGAARVEAAEGKKTPLSLPYLDLAVFCKDMVCCRMHKTI